MHIFSLSALTRRRYSDEFEMVCVGGEWVVVYNEWLETWHNTSLRHYVAGSLCSILSYHEREQSSARDRSVSPDL